MNIGLLTDNEVIKIVLKYQSKIPIEAFEGFIRQIIGWRNYMYTIYLLEGEKIPKMNFFGHDRKLNKKIMWEGKTDIQPIDDIIHKINEFSYAHHIERLMYLGNYMLICMIKPSDVYEIFMEWTIDAYDWVMMANVYSMSQYADGGMIVTKPYFSSSNYILKMSDYKNGEWSTVWDALYYNFINTHKDYLSKNYGTARQVAHWNKKTEKEKGELISIAKKYLQSI
jgi:deoxyribodipyrimidine photolyase-related protein